MKHAGKPGNYNLVSKVALHSHMDFSMSDRVTDFPDYQHVTNRIMSEGKKYNDFTSIEFTPIPY
jgi:hypothetical protein